MHRAWVCACIGLLGCGRIAFDPRTDAADGGPIVECGSDPRLIACYDFEGDLGDRSGHGNDANGTAVEYVAGHFGLGVQMTDTSRADLGAPSLDTTRWSFDAWIRPDPAPAAALELVFDHDQRWAIMLEEMGDGTFHFGCNSAVSQGFVVKVLSAGAWAHVACIDDGTVLRGYVDGALEDLGTGTGGGDTTVAAIGGNTPETQAQNPFLGTVDRMRIWNVALTPAELEARD